MQRTVSFGPYSLVERIGLGARSEVFRAVRRGERGDERFALKRALAGATHDRETQAILFGEAEILGKFTHPGIVRVHDFGTLSGVAFVAYELVEGVDLERLLKLARDKGTKLPMAAALTIAVRVAEALEYVHSFRDPNQQTQRPIVHRDVGPSNVLIGFDGEVKLADFGIAKVPGRNSTTGVGEIKGTIRYMSPEQVRGDELDPRSDLYGLGAVFLEMATGRPPFEGLRPVDVLQELAKGSWLDPDAAAPTVPEPVREVFRKVLAPSPAERYDTSAKLLEALRGLVQKLGVRVGDDAVKHAMGELFPARVAQDKSEESHDMADEKGGSDLDVFEGLAKKSVRSSNLPGSLPSSNAPPNSGRVSGLPAPVPPPPSLRSGGGKTTLLGVPAPALPTSTPLPLPPPTSKPTVKTISGVMPAAPPLPPPTSSSSPAIPATTTPLPPPTRGKSNTPLPPPPPTSAKAPSGPPMSKPPNTLVAAVPPPPKPPTSIGSAVGMPSTKVPELPPAAQAKEEATEEKTPPAGTAVKKSKGANVDMDWEDEEESTHVFEKRKHAMNKGPRPAAGSPSGPLAAMPPPKATGAASTLIMASGGTAAPRSVPPPVAPPQQKTIVMTEPVGTPAGAAAAVSAAPASTPMPARRPSEEATVVRPRDGGSGRLAVILAGLALVAVVGLGVFLLYPRKGDLKITVKSKTGQQVAKADIYVDGKRQCETTPCLVSDLDASSHSIRVMIGDKVVADQSATVQAGREQPVAIEIEEQGPLDKPAPAQTNAVASTASSAPPVAPAPEGTGFRVSGPSGVKVLVDGKDRGSLGSSPVAITDLEPGEHKLKFDGGEHYKTVEKPLTVTKGKVEDLPEHKPPVTKGQLAVDFKTSGTTIMLTSNKDGKKSEKKVEESQLKKLVIPTDEGWKITVTKKGFEDFSEEIKFDDGAYEKTMTVELTEKGKKPPPTPPPPVGVVRNPPPPPPPPPSTSSTAPSGTGTLSANSIPASNAIVDGRPVGKTPVVGLSVSAGSHTVTFRHPEKGSKSVTVNVKPGGKAVASVKFD